LGQGSLDVPGEIGFGTRVSDTAHDLAGGHVEAGDQGLGAMTDILEFTALGVPRRHRPVGVGGFERLNPGFLIDAHGVNTLGSLGQGLPAQVIDRPDAGVEFLGGAIALMAQPVTDVMGSKLGLPLKNARPCELKFGGQSLAEWPRGPGPLRSSG
jgi:hypothetical protein